MHRSKALLLALFLLPLSTLVTPVSATGTADSILIETLDGRGVVWLQTATGDVVYIDSGGEMKYMTLDAGEHETVWNYSLGVSVNTAALDSNDQFLAIGHSGGAILMNMVEQNVTEFIDTTYGVTSIAFDIDADLWLGMGAGTRRAEEYRGTTATGDVTNDHFGGLTDLLVLSDGRVITSGGDHKVFIHDFSQDPVNVQSLQVDDRILGIEVDSTEYHLFAHDANGNLTRWALSDWSEVSLRVDDTNCGTCDFDFGSLSPDDMQMHLGAVSQQKIWTVDTGNMTLNQTLGSQGVTLSTMRGERGELYILSAYSDSTKVRLYDVDTDGDGSVDSQDDFPEDSTQTEDNDGDGYGDNPEGNEGDAFPDDPTQWSDADGDGYGDNPDGANADGFPNNADQYRDSDGDGYGDDEGEGQDEFPSDPTQWTDSDGDGYGDNSQGTNADSCPDTNGFSIHDRTGCRDNDGDGWSDPDENWTYDAQDCITNELNCADNEPYEGTQWADRDGDSYGDNSSGVRGDACPSTAGNSTRIIMKTVSGGQVLAWTTEAAYGCQDTDGDGYADYGDDLPNLKTEYLDLDGDGIGSRTDFDDENSAVQSLEQHCLLNPDDTMTDCLALRDEAYQEYLAEMEIAEESPMSYNGWLSAKANEAGEGSSSEDTVKAAIMDAVTYGGLGFVAIIAALLIYNGILTIRRKKKALAEIGGDKNFDPAQAMKELSAVEDGGSFTAAGGVTDQDLWGDEIAPIEISHDGEEELGDEGKEVPEITPEESGDGSSLEDMAGAEDGSAAEVAMQVDDDLGVAEVASEPEPEPEPAPAAQQAPAEAPPIPAEGLPAGWTEEQWRWYGHQWLEQNSN